jgi:hypothetical protein
MKSSLLTGGDTKIDRGLRLRAAKVADGPLERLCMLRVLGCPQNHGRYGQSAVGLGDPYATSGGHDDFRKDCW